MKHFRGSKSLAAALCALALFAAVVLIPSPATMRASAKGNGNGGEWAVLAPVSYKNLTIFPVRGSDLAGSDAYITLRYTMKPEKRALITHLGREIVLFGRGSRRAFGTRCRRHHRVVDLDQRPRGRVGGRGRFDVEAVARRGHCLVSGFDARGVDGDDPHRDPPPVH